MKRIVDKIKLLLSLHAENEVFENKIFNIITLVGAGTCFLTFIPNIYNNHYSPMNLVAGLMGIIFSIFFYLSFFRGITKPLILPFQILLTLGITANWFLFQGIEGATALFFFPAMFLLIYTDFGKRYWPILIGYVFIAIMLVVVNYLHPEWSIPYPEENTRIVDLSFSFVVTLFILGYASIVLKKNFDRERLKTEQKNKELELSELRFRDIAMSSADWIWEVDANGVYTYCSEKVEEILGYTPDEMLGKTPFDFMPEAEAEKVTEEFMQIVKERKAFRNLENWNLTRTGLPICVHTSGVPVIDDHGNFIGYRGTDTDITERKLAEEKLKESEARLRELNAAKDKLFSIISHDLRNPFNAIIGFSNILAEQVKEKNYEDIDEYAKIIQDSSKRTMDLLINLLEWSRSQTGKIEFTPRSIEIVDLINEVLALASDAAQHKSITISSELPQSAIVSADRAMISSVLRNLISNAIKFTNPGGTIVVSVESKPDEVMVAVRDNGVGIKKDVIEKLFRIDENYTTVGTQKEEGTGLGLILCKEFVKKHGGKIWAESEENKGSTFYFTICQNEYRTNNDRKEP